MTLSEFDTKPLLSEEDAVAVLKDNCFADVCAYIAGGHDIRVSELLKGIWACRDVLAKEQVLRACTCALFPRSGWMRFGTAVLALRLAKATSCERELQAIVKQRWSSLGAHECNEVILGLSGDVDVKGWLPQLPVLFESNKDNEVRAKLLRLVNSLVRARNLVEARHLLSDFLVQMPANIDAYSRPDDFKFVTDLKLAARV